MQSCPELGQGEGDHFDGVEFRTRRLLRGSKRTSPERSETLRMCQRTKSLRDSEASGLSEIYTHVRQRFE